MKTVNDIINENNLSQAEFSRITNIPLRTVHAWCCPRESQNHRDPPLWQINLIDYFVRTKGYEA